MKRPVNLLVPALALAAGLLLAAGADRAAARGPISYNNPFRSFNIGGVNYGSMQWERQHRTRSTVMLRSHGGGLFSRRR